MILVLMLALSSCGKKEETKKEINVNKILEDAVPEATKKAVKQAEVAKEEQNSTIMDEMIPVFSALGAYMYETGSEYDAYSDEFYTSAFSYLAAYSKDRFAEGGFVQENNKAVLTRDAVSELSFATFASRQYGFDELPEDTQTLTADKNYEKFYVGTEADTTYLAQIKSVTKEVSEDVEIDKDVYDVEVELKKANETVAQLQFRLTSNELLEKKEEVMYNYAVLNAVIVK